MARKTLLFCFFILLVIVCPAQNQNEQIPFRMSARLTGTVPHPVSNKAFRMSFTGIYDITASCNVQIFRGISAGVEYKHNLWKTPDNKIAGLNTYAQGHHGGIRIGYDNVLSNTSTAYVALSAFTGQMHFYGISYRPDTIHGPLITKFKFKSAQLETGVFFYTEGSFAIGFNASYTFTNFDFNPYQLYLDQHKAYLESDLKGTVSHFNFGFNVVYSFWKTT
jgi:hypothetical protein